MHHLDEMDKLREGIGLQAYGQKDPLVEYKMSGYEMFDAMTASIRKQLVEHPEEFDPRGYLKPARQAVKDMVQHKIKHVLGCSGKA